MEAPVGANVTWVAASALRAAYRFLLFPPHITLPQSHPIMSVLADGHSAVHSNGHTNGSAKDVKAHKQPVKLTSADLIHLEHEHGAHKSVAFAYDVYSI